ncbi:transposase [Streptomyces cinereoruber]|uniref:transposase n=1 Tax=Streptomyces cinereoruber TaxID=67260 RepID=UPI0036384283
MGGTVRPPGGGGAGGEALGRSRGGFTTKIHLSADGRRRVLSLLLTAGQRTDCTQFGPVMERIRVSRLAPGRPRTTPDSVNADEAYSNRRTRRYLRRRGIRHVIPEKSDQAVNRVRQDRAGVAHPASTRSGTRSATPWNGRSTSSRTTGLCPRDTTSAHPSTWAP